LSAAAAVVGSALVLPASGSGRAQAPASCFGTQATLAGTGGSDVLIGTDGRDVIVALGGNDRIEARGGDDLVCGGAGDDQILGQDGSDIVLGEEGNDTVDGGTGFVDGVVGGPGDDRLVGNEFAAVAYLFASSAVTVDLERGTARGGEGSDTLSGFVNVFGSLYDDVLIGNQSGNVFFGIQGNDVIRGGEGFDVVGFASTSGAEADLVTGRSVGGAAEGNDVLAGIEGLFGGGASDHFVGDGHDNFLSTNGGNDVVYGGGGSDNIFGGEGDDQLYGEGGNDTLEAGPGRNTVSGGPGANDEMGYLGSTGGVRVDLAEGAASGGNITDDLSGIETVDGSNYGDRLAGNDGSNSLFGNAGNDVLLGRRGADFLDGGAGSETGDAGPGRDYCLDAELVTGCELAEKTPRQAGAQTAASMGPGLSRLLRLVCRSKPCLSAAGHSGVTRPSVTSAPPLRALIKSRAEPTCRPSGRGGITSIAPPKQILDPGQNGKVQWKAALYRRGSRRPIKTTVLAEGKLQGPAQEPGRPNAWTDPNGKIVGPIKRRVGPGIYYWEATVTLLNLGPSSRGKLDAYYQPPGSASAVPFCDFRRRR
jgi:Ca2+-binding RTX toxin-like protein